MKDEPLELDTRKRIYNLIKESPGIHFREISRRLEIPVGVVEYHIHYMLKREMIVARKEGRYKRYYAEGKHGSREKRVFPFLRKKIPREILVNLLMEPGMRHRDLKERLGVSGSTLTFHLKKMIKKDVVEEQKEGKHKRFYVHDPESASKSLVMYRESFMDDLVDNFTDTWMKLEF